MSMRYPMAKTLLAAARHEAAHAVIARRFGLQIKRISAKERGKAFVEYGDCRRVGPVGMFLTVMAGSAAEYLWHGTPRYLASDHDFTDLKRFGLKGEDFRVIWDEAVRLVKAEKRAIWKLAKRVQGKEIRL